MSLEQRFQEELRLLKELRDEVVERHPELASMLKGSADRDVERLLQGAAFQNALLRERLDDDFPEFINHLIHNISPQRLRPVPSATIIAFSPKSSLRQSQIIPAGTQVASVPVDLTHCRFTTTSDVEIHPLFLLDVVFSHAAGAAPAVKLNLTLQHLRLADWHPGSLRLFLAGDYGNAANLYLLLVRHLKQIKITAHEGGNSLILAPHYLKPAGLAGNDTLLPATPGLPFAGSHLQDYFIVPEKFLFLELSGWDRWRDRGAGSGFEILLQLDSFPATPFAITKDNFLLFATPAVNLFQQKAEPVLADVAGKMHLVRPADPDHCQVFSIDGVTGCVHGTFHERKYRPSTSGDFGSQTDSTYRVVYRKNNLKSGCEVFLSLARPGGSGSAETERLEIDLTCTNGDLPMRLGIGQIRMPMDSSPDCAEFQNVTPVTGQVLPAMGDNELWQFYAMLDMHPITLKNTESFVALLSRLVPGASDHATLAAAENRLAGIVKLSATGTDRLMGPLVVRGTEVRLKLEGDRFSSMGDLFIFGTLLDIFLSYFASETSFTHLVVQEKKSGVEFSWASRRGQRPLI